MQPLDLANARYVVNNQPMRGAHVLGAQEVDAEHLRGCVFVWHGAARGA